MIIELSSALWPAPITIDTAAPVSGAGGMVANVIKPSIAVKTSAGGPALVTWAPAGDPASSSPVASFVAVALVALLVTFAAVGVAATLD